MPTDDAGCVDIDYLDEGDMLGRLPVLIINLEKEGLSAESGHEYPHLVLYENDLVVERI